MISQRKPPINLQPDDLKFFRHEFKREIPNHQPVHFTDALVTPDGVLLVNKKIETESLYIPEHLFFFKGMYRLYYNLKSAFAKQNNRQYILAFDAWSFGYFHWMTEFIPRLFMVKDYIDEHVVILPSIDNGIWNRSAAWRSILKKKKSMAPATYISDSLQAFRLKSTCQQVAQKPIKTNALLFSPHLALTGNYNDSVMKELRHFYYADYGLTEEEPTKLVYISRRLASRRFIINENEVIENISRYGFEIVSLETMTFEQQVILLSKTKLLIGQHGAGLTNVLFMRNNSYVLELKTKDDTINLCYFALANAMNVNYLYQFCESDGRSVQDANVKVDVDRLHQNIKLTLPS